MNAKHLAQLAAETLKASGLRTPERLYSLTQAFGASYYGPESGWSFEVRAMVDDAYNYARTMLVRF